MAIIHYQLNAIAVGQDGKQVQVNPLQALIGRGPIVPVIISVPAEIAESFTKASKPVPNPVSGLGLIDTGATSSCVDEEVAKRLQLPIVNVVKMASASHAATDRNVYPLSFDILGLGSKGKITVNSPRIAGVVLGVQGLVLLIGRDVLARFCLFYNGPAGQITLSI